MFGEFTGFVADASGWAYAVILVFALLDALLPVVPSEATVITAGVVAANGDLLLPAVIVAAAVGAFLGDNGGYLVGRRFGERAKARFFSGDKAKQRVLWAERQLEERSGELIVVARFVPGGRTVVALTAGTVRFPWRRFAVLDTVAALSWALYAALLGYFGGQAFEDAPWKGLLLALGIALAVTTATEGVRALLRRRGQRRR
jgi:membrane protein DedA with SNARE-associated domain